MTTHNIFTKIVKNIQAQLAAVNSGFTTADKAKLDGIEAQANKTVVDSALDGTSTNPVQNKVVKLALDAKQDALNAAQLAAVNRDIDSEKVAQIETNKNNISSITNKINEIGIVKTISPITPSAANTYECITASKITLPEGKILRITASCIFLSSYATGIAIVRGTTKENSKILALSESATDYNALSVSTVCSFGSDQDIYVFLKTNSTGTTKVVMAYDIIAP